MNINSSGSRKKSKIAAFLAFVLGSIFVFSSAYADMSSSILPSADGNYTSWTPNSGSVHYTQVDESVCNGVTDYNFTTTVGNRDSYVINISSIPNGATISSIGISPCASRNNSGGGSSTMNVFHRFNGANSADSGSYAVTGTTPVQLATTTFSGLSLTKTPTSSLEIGAVYTSGTKGVRLSRMSTMITYTQLVAPSNLSATASATTSAISLIWSDNSTNESGFVIERSLNSVDFASIATTSANVTSYYDSGLSLGTTYYYRLKAYNAGAYTAYTATSSATTGNIPNAPTGASASPGFNMVGIVVFWTDSSTDETGFKVERSLDGVNFTNIATTSANATAYQDNAVSEVTTYYYRVRSYNNFGNSNYSSVVSATTIGKPTVVTNSATLVSSSTATLNGSANPNGVSSTGWFRYDSVDPVSCNDSFGTRTPASGGSSLGSGVSSVNYSQSISGLAASTTYYYCAIANNIIGTSTGSLSSFTTNP